MSLSTFVKTRFELKNKNVGDALAPVGPELFVDQLEGIYRLVFELKNTGAVALSDFNIGVKAHKNSAAQILTDSVIFNGTGPGAAPGPVYVIGSDAPKTLGAGKKTFVYMVIGPVYSFQFYAQVAAGNTTLDVNGAVRE